MATKFWCKELLMIKPDPAPYLLAARKPRETRLLASPGHPLYYTNPARFEIDELSGKTLGQQAFELQFEVNSAAITQGTTQLLNVPGLMECEAVNETLYFRFAWELPWYSLDKKYLKSGWNSVALVSDGEKISLQVNEYVAILLDTTQRLPVLDYTPHGISVGDHEVTGASGGYISVNNLDNLNFGLANSWTIGASFVYTVGSDAYNGIFGSYSDYEVPELNIDVSSNRVYANLSSNGSSRDIADAVYHSSPLTIGARYWTKLSFTGTQYTLALSEDGVNFQEQVIADTTTRVHSINNPNMIFMNRRVGNNQNVWLKGPLCTSYKDTYIIVDDAEYGKAYEYSIKYPQLSVGQISSPVNWTKVRSIRAVLL